MVYNVFFACWTSTEDNIPVQVLRNFLFNNFNQLSYIWVKFESVSKIENNGKEGTYRFKEIFCLQLQSIELYMGEV